MGDSALQTCIYGTLLTKLVKSEKSQKMEKISFAFHFCGLKDCLVLPTPIKVPVGCVWN